MRLSLIHKLPDGSYVKELTDCDAVQYDPHSIAWIETVRRQSPRIAGPHTVAIFADEIGCKYSGNLLDMAAQTIPQMFPNIRSATRYLEQRRWKERILCPSCGSDRSATTRPGRETFRCYGKCAKEFSVRTGTIFADSNIPLHKWLHAAHLIVISDGEITAAALSEWLSILPNSASRILKKFKSLDFVRTAGTTDLTTVENLLDCALQPRNKERSNDRKSTAIEAGSRMAVCR